MVNNSRAVLGLLSLVALTLAILISGFFYLTKPAKDSSKKLRLLRIFLFAFGITGIIAVIIVPIIVGLSVNPGGPGIPSNVT